MDEASSESEQQAPGAEPGLEQGADAQYPSVAELPPNTYTASGLCGRWTEYPSILGRMKQEDLEGTLRSALPGYPAEPGSNDGAEREHVPSLPADLTKILEESGQHPSKINGLV